MTKTLRPRLALASAIVLMGGTGIRETTL